MKNVLYLSVLAMLVCCPSMFASAAKKLETIKAVRLVKDELNDGDSFKVHAGGRTLHLRLYYVDSPETDCGSNTFCTERLDKQQDHFGIKNRDVMVHFGEQATEFVEQVLARPFTIHTGWAKAPGYRVYAFVETHDGDDLGHLLVQRGLARVRGTRHSAPDGTSSKLVLEELRDLRDIAMLNRVGIWKETDTAFLLKARKLRRALKAKTPPAYPLNLNCASKKQLETLDGVGPVTADRIIGGRPYQSLKDLLKIQGIRPKVLEKIEPDATTEGECVLS